MSCSDDDIEANAGFQSPDGIVITQCDSGESCHSATQAAGCAPTGCGSAPLAPGVPYYEQSPMCPEDGAKKYFVEKFSQILRTRSTFSMPDCQQNIWVFFQDIVDAPVGAWVWAPNIGYLQITGFNPYTGMVQLMNPCPQVNCGDQAPPGQSIPQCTFFILAAPPCVGATANFGSQFPYLNAGFTAPADGACITIAVTNTNGLIVDGNVSINGGTYRVSAVPSSTLITICNDGDGLVPGTVVDYRDAAGNLIVPIIPFTSNPCLETTSLSGIPIACVSGVQRPLVGTATNQVLAWDQVNQIAVFRTLGIPVLNCTELTVSLTLDPGQPPGTEYLITVVNTGGFAPADIITIGGTQFTVASITDATHMRVVPVVNPVVIQTFPPGSAVCFADCCTILDVRVDTLEFRVLANGGDCGSPGTDRWLWSEVDDANAAALGAPVTITVSPGDNATGNTASLHVINDSCVNDMTIFFTIACEFIYDITGTADQGVLLTRYLEGIADPSNVAALNIIYTHAVTHIWNDYDGGASLNRQSYQLVYTGRYDLAPEGSVYIRGRARMEYNDGDAATTAIVRTLGTKITHIGVSVR